MKLYYNLARVLYAFFFISLISSQVYSQTEEVIARINSGETTSGDEYTDVSGNVWSLDTYVRGGNIYPSTPSNVAISGTEDDLLYQTERTGPSSWQWHYQIPVPESGTYRVKLHFAEIYWTVVVNSGGVGSRVFDVEIEGNVVLDNYDILSKVPGATAVIETVDVEVTDGILNIQGVPVVNQAKISAIEVLHILDDGGSSTPLTISSISDQSNDEGESVSLSNTASGGSGNYSYSAIGLPTGLSINSSTGLISGSISTGASTGSPYSVTVSVNDGSETATESFNWTVNAVVEPITISSISDQSNEEGESVSLNTIASGGSGSYSYSASGLPTGLSINSSTGLISGTISTGASSTSPYSVTVSVNDGSETATASFNWTVNTPDNGGGISVEVIARINSGETTSGDEYTDASGNIWSLDTYVRGGNIYPSTPSNVAISGTEDDLLYQTERTGPSTWQWQYQIPVPESGTYRVKLHFAEIYWTVVVNSGGVGSRVFDVEIEGNVVLDNYDILSKVPGATAVIETVDVEVTDGILNIQGVPVVNQAKISAIEVLHILDDGGSSTPLTISSISDQSNDEGESVSLSSTASGGSGSYSYSASGLPIGLSINSSTGLISGSISTGASSASPYSVTVSVNDGLETVTESFNWTINAVTPSDVWTSITNVTEHIPRHENTFVQAGNRFYLLGGRESDLVEIYNYETNTWTRGAAAPISINHFQAVEYEGLIWAICGFRNNNFPTETPADYIYIYDPVGNYWIQGPEIPASRKRGSAGLVMYNDKFYVIGGIQVGHSSGWVNWLDEYDPATNTWRQLPDAPQARDHFHASLYDNKIYVAGGRRSGQVNTFAPTIPEVDVFDLTTETWLTGASLPDDLPTPRAGTSSVEFNGEILIIGGEGDGQAYSRVDALNPATGAWSQVASLNTGRHGTQAIATGGGVYITSGSPNQGGGTLRNMEVYGSDSPEGTAIVAGTLSIPTSYNFNGVAGSTTLNINNAGGNQAIFIRSISLSGTNASEFSINNSVVENIIIKSGESLALSLSYTGNSANDNASIVIEYGDAQEATIGLGDGSSLRVSSGTNEVNDNNVNSQSIMIYPNPSKDYVHLDIAASSDEEVLVNITSITGYSVYEKKYIGSLSTDISLKNLSAAKGLYIVNIKVGNQSKVFKLVRQ